MWLTLKKKTLSKQLLSKQKKHVLHGVNCHRISFLQHLNLSLVALFHTIFVAYRCRSVHLQSFVPRGRLSHLSVPWRHRQLIFFPRGTQRRVGRRWRQQVSWMSSSGALVTIVFLWQMLNPCLSLDWFMWQMLSFVSIQCLWHFQTWITFFKILKKCKKKQSWISSSTEHYPP